MKARPKTYCIYTLKTLNGAECWISCYPQQKWECEIKKNEVVLNKKGLTLIIPKTDFERQWKVV